MATACRPTDRIAIATHRLVSTQVRGELLLQHPAGLHEQAAVDRFVRHAHRLVGWKRLLQPAADLLGRPVYQQLLRNQLPQPLIAHEQAPLWPTSTSPGALIRIERTVEPYAAVPVH